MRSTIEFAVDGLTMAALAAGPQSSAGRPLIVALHGGTYKAQYFDVAGLGSRIVHGPGRRSRILRT